MYANCSSELITALKRHKWSPNFHLLAVSNALKGRGRKGGKPTAKRKCATPVENRVSMNMETAVSQCVVNSPIINSYNQHDASYVPSQSYTCIPVPPTSPPTSLAPGLVPNPFKVHFVMGNISVCNGCRGSYHQELLMISAYNTKNGGVLGSPTMQSRFRNVYYHCSLSCILAISPSFCHRALLSHPPLLGNLM